jgi:hypothetical protein
LLAPCIRAYSQNCIKHLTENKKYVLVYKNDTTHYLSEEFENMVVNNNGIASVCLNGKWGLIDGKGEVVYPFKSDCAIGFTDGFASIEINGKYGFINEKSEMFVKPKYDLVFNIHDGFVSVCKNKKWGVMDSSGHLIIPVKYDFIFEFYEGMAQVELNNKFGYFNTKGELAIPIKYEKADPYFKEGKAKVTLGGNVFYIGKNGEVIN